MSCLAITGVVIGLGGTWLNISEFFLATLFTMGGLMYFWWSLVRGG